MLNSIVLRVCILNDDKSTMFNPYYILIILQFCYRLNLKLLNFLLGTYFDDKVVQFKEIKEETKLIKC